MRQKSYIVKIKLFRRSDQKIPRFDQKENNPIFQGGARQRADVFPKRKTEQSVLCSDVVRMTGVEPARPAAQEPKSCAYANFATSAKQKLLYTITELNSSVFQ